MEVSPPASAPPAVQPTVANAPAASHRAVASSLADLHQSPFGGLDIPGLASAITALAAAIVAGVIKELSAVMTPVERGALQRNIDTLAGGGAGAVADSGASNRAPAARNATLPPIAAASSVIPSLASIARDPVVASAIAAAWTNSNPNTPGAKQEQGFWVVRDDSSGRLSVVQFPSNGTNDSLTPGAPPRLEGKTVVAFVHTHPNTAAEGYRSGPSPADQRFADAIGIPGIIRSHDGMYYFNPAR